MTARILDGSKIAEKICDEIKSEILSYYRPPTLAVILCGDDPASIIYVRKKREACAKVGINSQLIRLFENGIEHWHAPQEVLLDTIRGLNYNESIDGILVQLPLPVGIDKFEVFNLIDPLKDVDVFNPINVGLLSQERPRFLPCTPQAVSQLLYRSGISVYKKKIVIINRSNIIGRPLFSMLNYDNNIHANATVVICHDHTSPETLKELCLWADIIIVAVGKPKFLTADMVKENQVIIDVGVNRTGLGKVVGDVDFEPVAEKVSAISPSIGGVGPCTVAFLLKNVVRAYKIRNNIN